MARRPTDKFTSLIPEGMDLKSKPRKALTEKQKAALTKPKGKQLRKSYGQQTVYDSLNAPILDPEQRHVQNTQKWNKTKELKRQEAATVEPEPTPAPEPPADVEMHEGRVWVPEMNRYLSIEELQSQLNVLKRSQVLARARENFLAFIMYMFPDFEDPDNPDKTTFEVARHHALIAEKLEAVERGDCKRLIVTIRPRAGKSEMVSRMFSAWYMGRHMREQIIAAGYNYDFAVDEIGSKVLAILQSERYKEVFPDFQLRADKKAAGIMRNDQGGQLAVAGVGGSLTGRGAHCVMPWTRIETTEGSLTFDELLSRGQDAPSVLSYKKGRIVPRRIHAFATRQSDHYFRVKTSTGVLEATGEHPVCVGFDGTKPLFRRLDDLRVGDELVAIEGAAAFRSEAVRRVPDVWRSVHAQPGQVSESKGSRRKPQPYLLQRMLGALAVASENGAARLRGVRPDLPGMGVSGGAETGQGANPVLLLRGLLRRLPFSNILGSGPPEVFGRDDAVRQLRGRVHKKQVLRGERSSGAFVLQQGMLCGSYPWREYPAGYRDSGAEILPIRVSTYPGRRDADEAEMCRVRITGAGLASQGRGQGEQRTGQSGSGMPVLPRNAPQEPAYSRVESVERIEGVFTVGDMEVEDTHTYLLSSQHLVHNCLILDDLFKNWEDAESTRYRDTVWNWYTSTAKTRLMKNGRVVVIMCMTGETRVLMPDGSERRLDTIAAGEDVATYRNGHLSTSTVEAVRSNGEDGVYRITMKNGATVRANDRHPFLAHDGKELKWVRLKNLTTRHKIVTDAGSGENGKESSAPLMGVRNRLSAEGCACPTTTRKSGLTDIARRATRRLNGVKLGLSTGMASRLRSMTGFLPSKAAYALSTGLSQEKGTVALTTGNSLCVSTIATTQEKSEDSCATNAISPQGTLPMSKWHVPCFDTSDFILNEIASIEPDGRAEVFDLQIAETENFIANGLVSHNTRWHEDDIVGRLIDPTNEFYKEAIAKGFEVLEIPDVAGDGVDITKDPLNRQPGEVLWPSWFPDDALEMKTQDERVYYALYQGQPRPPGGVFFKEEHIQTYGRAELPPLHDLTVYGSCDLSASPERDRDASVYVTAGVDREGVLWIIDIWWDRVASDDAIDFILAECTRYQPTIVFWETGPITKTITPFLERRMRETHQYTYFETYPATSNKAARARGLRGMMASGMVRFPRDHEHFAPMKNQILKFTGSGKDNEDDAVDALSGFGMMLSRQTNYQQHKTVESGTPSNVITLDWIKRGSQERERRERLRKRRNGM